MTTTINDHLAAIRAQEDAFQRVQDGTPDAGDFFDLQGTDYQAHESAHRDRLKGVRSRRELAGTAKQYHAATAALAEIEPRVEKLIKANQVQIDKLQAQLNQLKAANAAAVDELDAAQQAVSKMEASRAMLQTEALLPPLVNQEIGTLINQAGARRTWNELTREAQKLAREGHNAESAAVRAEITALEASWPAPIRERLKALRGFYISDLV